VLGVGVTRRDGRAAIGGGLGGLLAAGRGARGQDEREDHEQGDAMARLLDLNIFDTSG
jgi:hypothetical protein